MEIGARMGGDFIGSDLVWLSTGYDYLKGVIDVSLDQFRVPVVDSYFGRSSVVFTAPEDVRYSAQRTGYTIYSNDEIYKQSVDSNSDL